MLEIFKNLLAIINKLLPGEEQRKAKALLKEDLALQKAIKEGDMETVERIRQRKLNYSKILGFLFCLLLVGCGTFSPVPAPPILGDNVPVKLKVGSPVIVESGEQVTIQSNKNTLVSDAYLYTTVVGTVPAQEKKN